MIPFIFGKIKFKEHLVFPIVMYEVEEKYLSLKIIFHLLEELKNEKFENKLKEIIKQYNNQPNNLKKRLYNVLKIKLLFNIYLKAIICPKSSWSYKEYIIVLFYWIFIK